MLLLSNEKLTTVEFHLETALLLARFSNLAYEKFEEDDAKTLKEKLANAGFSYLTHFNNQNTQGYVAFNDKFGIISFRGTEQNYYDILTDIKARLKDGGHEGFLSAFNLVKSDIEKAINSLNGLPLIITGHSLGGALAKIAVKELPESFLACYTYGSPAVCTKEKAEEIKTPVFRLVNSGDIVPRILGMGAGLIACIQIVLWLLKQACRVIRADPTQLDSWLKGLSILSTDVVKYVHFGKLFCFDSDGKFITDATKEQNIFTQALSKNMKSAFEDHSINEYILKLEKLKNEDANREGET